MPEPDWTTRIGAVASVIAAVTGVITVATGMIKNGRERRQVAASRWSMHLSRHSHGILQMKMRCDLKSGPEVTFRSVRVISPQGLRLCETSVEIDPTKPGQIIKRVEKGRFKKQFGNMDLTRQAGRDFVEVFVEVPTKPFMTRPLMRFCVEVRAEEATATRRNIVVRLSSPELEWTPKEPIDL